LIAGSGLFIFLAGAFSKPEVIASGFWRNG
jgi:hypothetical protein